MRASLKTPLAVSMAWLVFFAAWSQCAGEVLGDPVLVTGAGTEDLNGVYKKSIPTAGYTWADTERDYYVLSAATTGLANLKCLYFSPETSKWTIAKNGHEHYRADELMGPWIVAPVRTYQVTSSYYYGQEPPPTVASMPSSITVSGAGETDVNGVYTSGTPNAAHTWIDTGRGYYVLTPAPRWQLNIFGSMKMATDGNQAGLIDLYYHASKASWYISKDGTELYMGPNFYANYVAYNGAVSPGPIVTGPGGSSSTPYGSSSRQSYGLLLLLGIYMAI